jgi:hypothetical protein
VRRDNYNYSFSYPTQRGGFARGNPQWPW